MSDTEYQDECENQLHDDHQEDLHPGDIHRDGGGPARCQGPCHQPPVISDIWLSTCPLHPPTVEISSFLQTQG